jgi:hypothetical protein
MPSLESVKYHMIGNKSILLPVVKGKGDPLECGCYTAIKLLEHGMKVLKSALEKRKREQVNIDDMKFGFTPGKGTTDALFLVRQLHEKFRERHYIMPLWIWRKPATEYPER